MHYRLVICRVDERLVSLVPANAEVGVPGHAEDLSDFPTPRRTARNAGDLEPIADADDWVVFIGWVVFTVEPHRRIQSHHVKDAQETPKHPVSLPSSMW
jgi:hypothetical protein